jgi:hypothetical protein
MVTGFGVPELVYEAKEEPIKLRPNATSLELSQEV